MPKSKLMTPLFINSNFNRDGRRMRAVYEKTVSNGTVSYRLWHSAGKPDLHYRNGENDRYYLYVEVNGYLAPLGMTEYVFIGQSGTMAVDEQYGSREVRKQHLDELRETKGMDAFFAALDEERAEIERLGADPACQADYIRKCLDERVQTYLEAKENGGQTFPDFVGALVLNDLAKCVELSAAHQAMWWKERQAAVVRKAEEEKAFCEEQNRIAEQAVSDAIQVIRDGGTLKNDPVKFYRSRYHASSYSIVLYLMRQYHVDVPLRTQGWINDKLVSVTIKDGRCTGERYLSSGKKRGSEKFFIYMDRLIRAVAEQQTCQGALQID